MMNMSKRIREDHYAEEMSSRVMPYLDARRTDGTFQGYDGNEMHFARFQADDAHGVLVICHGFTESCEKFHELTYYFLLSGFTVYIPEHRGHGLSYRKLADTTLTHIDRFEEYVRDFDRFNQTVVAAEGDQPRILFAHSMGGAVAALYLEQHPGFFQKAVLSSPMVVPSSGGIPLIFAKTLVAVLRLFGQSEKRAFISQEYPGHEEFEDACSDSRPRFEHYEALKSATKTLQNYSPTYGWVGESLRVKNMILRHHAPEKVTIPVKLYIAENDTIVDRKPQEQLAAALPNCSMELIKGSKHEIYGSTDDILDGYLNSLFAFLES